MIELFIINITHHTVSLQILILSQNNKSRGDSPIQLFTTESLPQSPGEGPDRVGQSDHQIEHLGDTGGGALGYRRLTRSNCNSLCCYHCYIHNFGGCRGLECDNILRSDAGDGCYRLYYRPCGNNNQPRTSGITDFFTRDDSVKRDRSFQCEDSGGGRTSGESTSSTTDTRHPGSPLLD